MITRALVALLALLLLAAHAPVHAQAPTELAKAWRDLGDESNDNAAASAKTLAANPAAALDFLERELAPLPADPTPRVRELVAQLRAPRYAKRERAHQQLAVFGPLADAELNRLLAAGLGAEEKDRVESLLAQRVATFAATEHDRRLVRTLALVSSIDDPRARALSLALAPLRDWSIVDPQFPPLYAELLTSDLGAQAVAAVALIKLGEPALIALPRFIELMGGDGPLVPVGNHSTRVGDHIVQELPSLGVPIVEPLLAAIASNDANANRRERITAVLISIHDPKAFNTFVEALGSREKVQVAIVAARALANYKADAVDPLLTALATGPADVRSAAADSLAAIGDPRAIAPIAELLHAANPDQRRSAIYWLGQFKEAAVGSLILALRSDEPNLRGDPEVRTQIMQQIAIWRSAEALAAVIEGLSDPQPEVRAHAIFGLNHRGSDAFRDPVVVDKVFAALADESPRVRAAAARFFAYPSEIHFAFDKQRVARALLAALDDKEIDVRIDVVQALGWRQVAEAVDRLIPLLADDTKGEMTPLPIRLAAAEALGHIGDPRAIEPLRPLLKNVEADPRVIRAVGELRDAKSVPLLIGFLDAGQENQRNAAAEALGKIKDRRAVEPLIAALSGRGEIVDHAARSLGELRDPRAIDPLINLIRNPAPVFGGGPCSERPSHNVTYPLQQMGLAAVEPLARALSDANPQCRQVAAYVLNNLSSGAFEVLDAEDMQPAIEPLVAAMADESADVRFHAAEALSNLGDQRAAFPLLEILRAGPPEGETYFYWNVPNGLSRLKTPEVVPDLVTLLDDERPLVRAAAVRALGSPRDPRAVEPILRRLEDADPGVRLDAAHKLGWMKIAAAVDPLIALLEDPSPDVRGGAAESLGRLGDARAVEPLAAFAEDPDGDKGGKIPDRYEDDPRAAAAIALVRLHDPRGATLVAHRLADDDPKRRERFAPQLSRANLDDPNLIPPLIAALDDPDIRVRIYIVNALGSLAQKTGSDAATDALLAKLNDRENYHNLLHGLAKTKTDRAYAAIAKLLDDGDESIRALAAYLLADSGDASHVALLIAHLNDPSPKVREALLRALTKLHATSAVDEIAKLKSDDDPMVALYANRAVDRLQSQ